MLSASEPEKLVRIPLQGAGVFYLPSCKASADLTIVALPSIALFFSPGCVPLERAAAVFHVPTPLTL